MTTQASIGYGAVFELHNGVGFEAIGEVTNLTPPNVSVDAVDATHTESEGAAREFIAGLVDYGEIKIEMNLVAGEASDALIRSTMIARAAVQWRITFPGGPSPSNQAVGSGILTGYETEAPLDDKMTANLTIKVTGVVTYT